MVQVVKDCGNAGRRADFQNFRRAERNIVIFQHQAPLGMLRQVFVAPHKPGLAFFPVAVDASDMRNDDSLRPAAHHIQQTRLRVQVCDAFAGDFLI